MKRQQKIDRYEIFTSKYSYFRPTVIARINGILVWPAGITNYAEIL